MKFDFSGKSSELPRVPNYLGGRDRRNVSTWVLGGGFLLLLVSNFEGFSKFAKAILPGQASRVDTRVPLPPYHEPLPHDAVQLLPSDDDRALTLALATQAAENLSSENSPSENSPDEPKKIEAVSPQKSSPATSAGEVSSPEKKTDPAITLKVPPLRANPLPPNSAQAMPNHRKYYSAVNIPLLAAIQNEAPFRQTETEVWYHLFDVVNKAPPEQLKKEATRIHDFATLFGQSNFYRGQAIAMTGIAKWYQEIKSQPADNAAGIAKYYQIGFQTNPREDNPIVVFVIDLPENLPRGTVDPQDATRFLLKPGVPFAFEGIFFKNFAYSALDGEFRYMPSLLAKTIRIQPSVEAAAPPTNPMLYVTVLLVLGLAFFLVTFFLSAKRKKLQFVIPAPAAPLAIPELSPQDGEPVEAWPVLPEEK